MMYLEGDSPHQIVTLCVNVLDSLISLLFI